MTSIFLLRDTEHETLEALETELQERAHRAATVITLTLERDVPEVETASEG